MKHAHSHPIITLRFAPRTFVFATQLISEYAPVLYLEELKDVSSKTDDQVKYLCSHKCVGIAKIAGVKRLSQPGMDEWMESYAEVLEEEVIGVEDAVDLTSLRSHYKKLVDLQHETTSSVRFTKDR